MALGITQEELAWRADMHRTYIADIERGARNLTLRSLVNLAKALQVTVGKLLSEEPPPPVKSERAPDIAPVAASREILLVEDNVQDAEWAVRAFRRGGLTNPLKVVRTAEEALEWLSGEAGGQVRAVLPQLILLDLNLPRMQGLEFLKRIKADERTRDIPVVVLTCSESDRTIIECGRLGAANYIIKPFGVEQLVQVAPKVNLHLTLGPPEGAARKARP